MPDTLDLRIIRLRKYGDKLTCREIAAELGIPESRVYSAIRRAGLQRQYRGLDRRTVAREWGEGAVHG